MTEMGCLLALTAVLFTCRLSEAQRADDVPSRAEGGAAIRLVLHENRTEFKLGDPIVLDLIFSGGLPGYVVRTDTTPYLPTADAVFLYPAEGWTRSHSSYRGQGENGNAIAELGASPVRVPVLLNRTITFQKPGHYEVSVETERLRATETAGAPSSLETCPACRRTNAVNIDVVGRDPQEEAILVESLSRELGDDARAEKKPEEPSEELKALQRDLTAALEKTGTSEAGSQRHMEALLQRVGEFAQARVAKEQERADAKREAAVRLAYLPGDAAVRAKVRFIVAGTEDGDADPINPIMVDGLPSSRDYELQMHLLEAAWRDPGHVPTSQLQTALRQSKELVHEGRVTDDALMWAGTDEDRTATRAKYQAELNEIIGSLPQRSDANRAKTVAFLKTLAVPQDLP